MAVSRVPQNSNDQMYLYKLPFMTLAVTWSCDCGQIRPGSTRPAPSLSSRALPSCAMCYLDQRCPKSARCSRASSHAALWKRRGICHSRGVVSISCVPCGCPGIEYPTGRHAAKPSGCGAVRVASERQCRWALRWCRPGGPKSRASTECRAVAPRQAGGKRLPGARKRSALAALFVPTDLLLQHDAVHARLEQGEDQARLALEVAQPVQDFGGRLRRHGVEGAGQLRRRGSASRCVRVRARRREGTLLTVFMFSASRSYSSSTSCSKGESSGGESASIVRAGSAEDAVAVRPERNACRTVAVQVGTLKVLVSAFQLSVGADVGVEGPLRPPAPHPVNAPALTGGRTVGIESLKVVNYIVTPYPSFARCSSNGHGCPFHGNLEAWIARIKATPS